MSQAKKKPPMSRAKQKEQINKKALVWIVSVLVVIVIAVALLLIFDN